MKPAVVIPQLLVQWFRNGTQRVGDVSVSDNGAYIVNTLNVSENNISDASLYECVASIAIPDSPTIMIANSSNVVIVSGKLNYIYFMNVPLDLSLSSPYWCSWRTH